MSNYFRALDSFYKWGDVKNVENPEHYVDDFSEDRGYFTEDNGIHEWKIENGVLTTSKPEGMNITYMHIFEKNVTVKARLRVRDLNPPDAIFGMMLRYNANEAFVRFGCYVKSGIWFVDSREGKDFLAERFIRKHHEVKEGEWIDIEFTVDGDSVKLTVDGELMCDAKGVNHQSPGRIAFYAHRLALDVDSIDAAFLSGQGVLWKNVNHTKLPGDIYMEGGSVFELSDGKLIYEHYNGTTYESTDNGAVWTQTEKWTHTYGYPNILRLNNGQFMKMGRYNDNGVWMLGCELSDDDGKTWTRGGNLCTYIYPGTECCYGGNMNDKITQISNGRIFYSMNYECRPRIPVDGRIVFCEFYYSDDNGATWTKSETDSWTFGGGNENDVEWFGECKILECDDGSLRIYNSWNDYGCVVYSESFDGGKTWGKLIKMPELVCSRSSMQFYRDPYADNNTTYYMVWVYSPMMEDHTPMTRSRLSLAKSTDGKTWEFLGDVWRWEHRGCVDAHISHVVDAFVKTNKDYVICGAGYSEHLKVEGEGGSEYHHAQRQHLYSIKKSDLKPTELKPV